MTTSIRKDLWWLCMICCATSAWGLAAPENPAKFALFDRFQPTCPADADCIQKFDPNIIENDTDKSIWVAVHRSNNNKPSVMIKDDFLHAMRAAVEAHPPTTRDDDDLKANFVQTSSLPTPVAVARLTPSPDFDDCFLLDSMRCVLKKEDTDEACDGGSEHTEALSTAIDALLLYFLANNNHFEGAIRTKATLVSGILLEDRGFRPVEALTKDMVTHTSSIDACLSQYAERSVSTVAKSPGAMQRALDILSSLGRLDREADIERAAERESGESNNEDDADYDPWASMKKYL